MKCILSPLPSSSSSSGLLHTYPLTAWPRAFSILLERFLNTYYVPASVQLPYCRRSCLILQFCEVGIIIPILCMRKLRLKELAQELTVIWELLLLMLGQAPSKTQPSPPVALLVSAPCGFLHELPHWLVPQAVFCMSCLAGSYPCSLLLHLWAEVPILGLPLFSLHALHYISHLYISQGLEHNT